MTWGQDRSYSPACAENKDWRHTAGQLNKQQWEWTAGDVSDKEARAQGPCTQGHHQIHMA